MADNDLHDAESDRDLLDAEFVGDPKGAERRCILTRESGSREMLIRLALGPGGQVAADLGARLQGRGAWVRPERALVARAMARGQLQGVLKRALKAESIILSPTLVEEIDRGLRQRLLDQLGLARRAGLLIWGHERVSDAIGRGRVALLLHVGDAGQDGVDKLEMKRRAASPDTEVMVLPFDRATLSVALGAGNVVSAALVDAGAAARVRAALARLVAWDGPPAMPGMTELDEMGAAAVAVGAEERH